MLFFILFTYTFASLDLPKLNSRVMDMAHILSQSAKSQLISILESEEKRSSNQVVIATVKSLNGYEIEQFSNRLARHWAIGQKGSDNGVLLLIAPNERKTRIEVGYGLEGFLTDKTSHEIITYTMLPYFKKGDFDSGVLNATEQILNAINGKVVKIKKEKRGFSPAILSFLAFGFAMFCMIFGSGFTKKLGQSLFGGSFMALFLHIISNSNGYADYFITILIFTLIFYFVFIDVKEVDELEYIENKKGFKSKKRKKPSYGGYGGYSSSRSDFGSSSSSSFSGGGGSFGGGGASGGW